MAEWDKDMAASRSKTKHKPWMMQSTDTHDMKSDEIQWINYCCSPFVTYCYCICSQHGTTQSCIYLTIENAFQSDRLLLKKRSWTMITAGRSPSKSLLRRRHPSWYEQLLTSKESQREMYPWEGTLAVDTPILPILPSTTIIYNLFIGGLCWYISRVLSQGYPTFPFEKAMVELFCWHCGFVHLRNGKCCSNWGVADRISTEPISTSCDVIW